MKDLKKVEVTARVIKNTKVDPPTSFTVFQAVAKNGEKFDVRFKRCCSKTPTSNAVCYIAAEMMHMQRRDDDLKPPILWVDDVETIEPDKATELPF